MFPILINTTSGVKQILSFIEISHSELFSNSLSTMRALQVCMLLIALCYAADSKRLIFENRLGYTIWVGSLGNTGKQPIENGGWRMKAGTQRVFDVANDYAGRVWARTGCRFDGAGNGPCETGDCGNRLLCRGKGGAPPATLVEFTFVPQGQDFYDISLVDGYNVPAKMAPTKNLGSGYRCTAASCPASAPINKDCPQKLKLYAGSRVVGCKSACLAFNTDQYCCRGQFGTPATCVARTWPVNYPKYFKDRCPLAYSYAYDDQKSTFTCNSSEYKITFG